MDQQRPILYLLLFFLGFLIWSTWQKEHAPKPIKQEIVQTSSNLSDAIKNSNLSKNSVDPALSGIDSSISEKMIHIKTDVLDLYINTNGGTIVQADLPSYPISLEEKNKPIRIIDKNKGYVALSALLHKEKRGNSVAPGFDAKFSTEKEEYLLQDGEQKIVVKLEWNNDQGLSVTKLFEFERGKFVVKQEYQVRNNSNIPWTGRQTLLLSNGDKKEKRNFLGGGSIAYTGAAYYNEKYIKVSFGDIKDEKLEDRVKGGWAAMLEHYFVSAWIPPKDLENIYFSYFDKNKNLYYIGTKTPNRTIESGSTSTFHSQFYVGPTDQEKLAIISKGLDLTVDYGIFAFVSKPIFAVMNFIHSYVGNWGWTIIFLTLFIKILFFYPSAISYRSMAKMKKMSPKIKAINEKYKNDPQQKQKEIMTFYRKEKINPLGGCLPMVIQMPVFMGLYWVLQESVELRQAPWLLWYQDLSIKDPTYILPIIYGTSMFIQQKLNPTTVQDPMQQKIFTYLPVVFTVMFLFFPAGLVLYWVVNNVLSIIQQYIINKKIIGDT